MPQHLLLFLDRLFEGFSLPARLTELLREPGLLLFRQREFIPHGGDHVGMQQAAFEPVFDVGGAQGGHAEQEERTKDAFHGMVRLR